MFALTVPEEAHGDEEAEEDTEREAHFRFVDAFIALRQLDAEVGEACHVWLPAWLYVSI
jgi:hypothetical protein